MSGLTSVVEIVFQTDKTVANDSRHIPGTMDARAAARLRCPHVGAVRAGVALPGRSARPSGLVVIPHRGRRRPLRAAYHAHGRRTRRLRAHGALRPAVRTSWIAGRQT